MRNLKLTIEYDGSGYAGWQVQRSPRSTLRLRSGQALHGLKTVQETIEKALEEILQEKVKLIASGRTDAGVHARGQVANFKTRSKLSFKAIQNALNSLLPKDIAIHKAEEVPLNFHARYSATSKSYRYTILNNKVRSPLNRYYVTFIPYPLDVKAMQGAARPLVGRHDFRSFQAKGGERPTLRTIKHLEVKRRGNFIYIDVEADGFLYNMVRNIVGTLVEVGRGKLKPKDVKEILRQKARSSAGPTAPAQGLCLMKVSYSLDRLQRL